MDNSGVTIVGEKPKKRKRYNKNKRINWRKRIDISDVDKHFREKRRDEVLGDFGQVQDADLFFVSKKPGDEFSGKRLKEDYYRCYTNLRNKSAVQDPLIKRNRVRKPEELTSEWVKRLKREKELIQPSKVHAAKQRKEASRQYKKQRKEKKALATGLKTFYDVWEKNDDVDSGLGEELFSYYLEETCQKPHKMQKHSRAKTSLLAACEVPQGGASYNPSANSHQKLWLDAFNKEMEKIKKEQAIHQNTTAMFPTKTEAPTEETWLEEMSGGLFDDEPPEQEEDKETESGGLNNPPVRDEDRKTRQKKRREQRERLIKIKANRYKKQIRQESEVFRVKSINNEIEKEEQNFERRKKIKQKKMEQKKYQAKKMSPYDFEPQDLEVNFPDDIKGKLLLVKTEGDLLEDRYKSLQARNIIETRVRQKIKRKYKRKKFIPSQTKTPREKSGFEVQTKLGPVTIKI